MLMGVIERSADRSATERAVARAFATMGDGERFSVGPLTVAWNGDSTVQCARVNGVGCVIGGRLFDPAELALDVDGPWANDAELVARAYRVQGEAALTRLRGRYAVALWDESRQRGVLACDLLAVEPLFFSRESAVTTFATELRPLLNVLPRTPGPDPQGVTSWLAEGTVAADRTMFAGVSRLRPGQLIDFDREDVRPARQYWRRRFSGTLRGTRDELADGLRDEIDRSVRRRLSPGLSGVILSGGLDSSTVTALARRHREPGTQLRTYSAVFPGAVYDESWKVRSLTDALGIDPCAYEVAPQGALSLGLSHAMKWGVPLSGLAALIDSATVEGATRDGADVVLDGQTGDETLGFSPYLLADRLRRGRLLGAWRLMDDWPIGRVMTRDERVWALKAVGARGAAPYRLNQLARRIRNSQPWTPPWLNSAAQRRYAEETHDEWAWKLGATGPRWWRYQSERLVEAPQRELRIDYLRHRAGATGIGTESPLYDFDLIDYCLRLPPELYFDRAFTRPLVRHAMRDLIPDDVRLNGEKADFSSFCFEVLTEADAAGVERLLMGPEAEIGAYADMEWVRRRWYDERPKPGQATGPWGTSLWRIVAMECWLRALSDPAGVEELLASPDIPRPSIRRVELPGAGTFSRLAPAAGRL